VIGVNIRIHQATFAAYLEMTQRRGAVALSYGGWSEDFPDPSNFIETLFHSRNIQQENSQNGAFYTNHELDALLDRAHVETDPARRIALYQDAEHIVVEDAPWAFLFYPIRTTVDQPYVHGYIDHPVWTHDIRPVWLDLPLQRYAERSLDASRTWGALAAFALPWGAP
jgi:ABC-type transport system substrate-binding protein